MGGTNHNHEFISSDPELATGIVVEGQLRNEVLMGAYAALAPEHKHTLVNRISGIQGSVRRLEDKTPRVTLVFNDYPAISGESPKVLISCEFTLDDNGQPVLKPEMETIEVDLLPQQIAALMALHSAVSTLVK